MDNVEWDSLSWEEFYGQLRVAAKRGVVIDEIDWERLGEKYGLEYREYDYGRGNGLYLNVKGKGPLFINKKALDLMENEYDQDVEEIESGIVNDFYEDLSNDIEEFPITIAGRNGGWWGFRIEDLERNLTVLDESDEAVQEYYLEFIESGMDDVEDFIFETLEDFNNIVVFESTDSIDLFKKEIKKAQDYWASDSFLNDMIEF